MSDKRATTGADIFASTFQFGTNPFAGFMMPGAPSMPRLDAMPTLPFAPATDAIMKGIARWNLEIFGFMSRRAQAYLEIPARISQCRTPNDLMREQTQFWQKAMEQYADTSRRLNGVATQMMAGAAAAGMPKAPPRKRDYINVPGLGDARPGTPGPNGRGERRVA